MNAAAQYPGQAAGDADPGGQRWDAAPAVTRAVEEWLRWVAQWELGKVRHRNSVCRLCTGSPLLIAAGFESDVPHQVVHALVARMHKIIDNRVDAVVAAQLPLLKAELDGAAEWQASGRFDPRAGLDPEYDGGELDPAPLSDKTPFLFTLEELAAAPVAQAEPLPRPPLTPAERAQLRREYEISGEVANAAGRVVSFELAGHRQQIQMAINRFVEPQISDMLSELSRHLDYPGFS